MQSESLNMDDFSTGQCRCDDISSFKLRINLRAKKSSSVQASALHEDEDFKYEELVVSWQERILSPAEIKFYSDLSNCTTDLHRQYHEKALNLLQDETSGKNMMFTYTSEDQTGPVEKKFLYSEHRNSSELTGTVERGTLIPESEIEQRNVSKTNIVDYDPSFEVFSSHRTVASGYQYMSVMVDPGYLIDGCANEVELVSLKWQPKCKVLSIYPDFNDISGPGYSLDGLSDALYQYSFWVTCEKNDSIIDQNKINDESALEFAVENLNNTDADNGTVVTSAIEISDYHRRHPKHFPCTNEVAVVNFFGEFRAIHNFCGNIFISYQFKLPKGWHCNSKNDLSGVTNSIKCTESACRVNHLFELHLTFTASDHNKLSDCLVHPQMYLEVMSIDTWGRTRREGYGWIRLPIEPGKHSFTVDTWQPVTEQSRVNSLRNYFIGANTHLSDRTYVGLPDLMDGTHLSRYGFHTLSAGSISVDLNIVIEGQHVNYPSRTYPFNPDFTAILIRSVNNTLRAFFSARQRIQNASNYNYH